ncbi:MAG TPA: hypothetical protein VI299_22195, partial [Polyangiales bacterium]
MKCLLCNRNVDDEDFEEHVNTEGLCRPGLAAVFESVKLPLAAASFPVAQAKVARALLTRFASHGLLVKSVQANCPEKHTSTNPPERAPGADVTGMQRFCWSLIHPTTPQPLFQMSPASATENLGLRCLAIVLDWTLTWDRFVDASVADATSGSTFAAGEKLATSLESVTETLKNFLPKAAKAAANQNNEVRTITV